MSNLESEPAAYSPSPATEPSQTQSAVEWITERQDDAVERLFALLEQNQAAIAALAQAWRHTKRALELSQADLEYTKHALAAERLIRGRPLADQAKPRTDAAA